MSKLGRPAFLFGGIFAALVGGLLFAACQSSGSPAGASSTTFPTTASSTSSVTGSPSTTSSSTSIGSSTTTGADISLGKIVYASGVDASGKPIPRSGGVGMMGQAGCITCHRADGRGGTINMMGEVDVPDIRWSTLTAAPTDPADKAFDADSFFLAVTRGIDPTGAALKVPMPRWQLTRAESDALIEYLKTL